MMMAQRLYEAGYITYMRTDSTNLSEDAVSACREYIKLRHGDRYLPDEPKVYGSKSGAQEAHEEIRPSNIDITPGSLGELLEGLLGVFRYADGKCRVHSALCTK